MDTDTQSGFVRQRRNLMVMSLVVLFVEIADLKIDKLSIFGNEASLGNTQAVNTALWVLLIYWFVRYAQYFHDMDDTGFITSVMQRRAKLVEKFAFNKLNNAPDFAKSLIASDGSKLYAVPGSSTVSVNTWSRTMGRLLYMLTTDPDIRTDTNGTHEFSVSGWQQQVLNFRATTYVFVRTKYFTEYILPFLLFSLPWISSNTSVKAWVLSLT